METHVYDWLHLVGRWIHIIAGIMWIGDSFLFMWLDRHLTPVEPKPEDKEAVVGELWMVHSGGFYQVEKRKYLSPGAMPRQLYWFKWESYTTWLSGFFLLVVVYYTGGGTYLVDPTVSPLSPAAGAALGVGLLAVGWLVYDLAWRYAGERSPRPFAALGFAALIAITYGLGLVFTGRAAFMHVGALIGTVMAGNVFFRIIPAQRALIAATKAGTTPDVTLGARAKTRSTHNHYLTLPLLFTMLSNHFPATYGHPQAWLVLALLMVFGFTLKLAMNGKALTPKWVLGTAGASIVGVLLMTAPIDWQALAHSEPPPVRVAAADAVPFAKVHTIIQQRCVTCHANEPTSSMFRAPPAGVVLESAQQVHRFAERIKVRAVDTRTMPLGNLTAMTDEERELVKIWVEQGAPIE